MNGHHEDYQIVFKERDRILKGESCFLLRIETEELDEINALREIVMEVQTPSQLFLSTT